MTILLRHSALVLALVVVGCAPPDAGGGTERANIGRTEIGKVDFNLAEWFGAHPSHIRDGRDGRAVTQIVIHVVNGSAASARRFFQQAEQVQASGAKVNVSAHYIVGRDGSVTQAVAESDTAFHAGNREVNLRSIGIEHEGLVTAGYVFTRETYVASAALVRDICQRHNIQPCDRPNIVGHNDVVPRHCPGAWDWNYYLALVRDGSTDTVPTRLRSDELPVYAAAGDNVVAVPAAVATTTDAASDASGWRIGSTLTEAGAAAAAAWNAARGTVGEFWDGTTRYAQGAADHTLETTSTWAAAAASMAADMGNSAASAVSGLASSARGSINPEALPGWRPGGSDAYVNYYAGTGYYGGANDPYYGTGYAAAGGLAACWNAGGACELENAPVGLGDCRLGIVVCSGGDPVCTRRAGCTGLVAAGGIDQGLGTTASTTASCTPAAEQCNGRDDDCDGQIDEASDLKQVEGLPCPSSGVGACQAGAMKCAGGELQCQPRAPEPERCDGLDNDCNGTIDDGAGGCAATTQVASKPAPELCNGKDEDLDGFPDNGNPGGGAPCTLTEAGGGQGTRQGTVMCTRGELQCLALSFAVPGAEAGASAAAGAAASGAGEDPGVFGCALDRRSVARRATTGAWGLAILAALGWFRGRRRRVRPRGCPAGIPDGRAGAAALVALLALALPTGCGLVASERDSTAVEQTLAAPSRSFVYDPSEGLAECQTIRVLLGVARGASCATGRVVELDLENEYLPQVVTCEMPSSWDPEALKAQAVAAREFACHNKANGGKAKARGCADVTDDTSSQMYSCGKTPSASARAAVSSTRGQVLLKGGYVFETEYFGKGGHGRGLSQLGAQSLAQQGASYDQILATYYGHDVRLVVGGGEVSPELGPGSTYAAVGGTPVELSVSRWTEEARAAAAAAAAAGQSGYDTIVKGVGAAGDAIAQGATVAWDKTGAAAGAAAEAASAYWNQAVLEWQEWRSTSSSSTYAALGYQPPLGDLNNTACINTSCNNERGVVRTEFGTVAGDSATGRRYCYSACSARLATAGLYGDTGALYGRYPLTGYAADSYAASYYGASTAAERDALLAQLAQTPVPATTPAATTARCVRTTETCNGLDDDCDGQIDEAADVRQFEGLPCPVESGQGACHAGTTLCAGGELHCQPRPASPELCDGFDNDCNGTIDDVAGGCATTTTCTPKGEQCNGQDDDCDGFPDNGNPGGGAACTLDAGGLGTLMCAEGRLRCVALVLAPTPALASGANPLAGVSGGDQAGAVLACGLGPGASPRGGAPVLVLALLAVARLRRRRRSLAALRSGDRSRQAG